MWYYNVNRDQPIRVRPTGKREVFGVNAGINRMNPVVQVRFPRA